MTEQLGTSGWWLRDADGYRTAMPMSTPGNVSNEAVIIGWTYNPAVVVNFLRGEAAEFDYEHG